VFDDERVPGRWEGISTAVTSRAAGNGGYACKITHGDRGRFTIPVSTILFPVSPLSAPPVEEEEVPVK